jgi:hypothetical protein
VPAGPGGGRAGGARSQGADQFVHSATLPRTCSPWWRVCTVQDRSVPAGTDGGRTGDSRSQGADQFVHTVRTCSRRRLLITHHADNVLTA